MGSLKTGRKEATATLLGNGKVLIAGGEGPTGLLDSAELFSPVPPNRPGRLGVGWGINKRKRIITATVPADLLTTYTLTATLGRKTKTGTCTVVIDTATCTITVGRGKWKLALRPRNLGGLGPVNAKSVKF